MSSEIPLDQGFRGVLTVPRPGERTPTGAGNDGLRPGGNRPRGAAESGQGTESTGHLGRHPPGLRAGAGGRSSRRPAQATARGVGSTGPSGNRRRRRPVGGVRATGRRRRGHRAPPPSGGRATEPWSGADRSGATPTGLGTTVPRSPDRWHGQPGQRESVIGTPANRETGSAAEKRHRPPRPPATG